MSESTKPKKSNGSKNGHYHTFRLDSGSFDTDTASDRVEHIHKLLGTDTTHAIGDGHTHYNVRDFPERIARSEARAEDNRRRRKIKR